MKSNNNIVEEVYKKYKVRSLITKMIDYSIKDGSCDDLEQYIYEMLLTMENKRLNNIYSSGKLRNFISQIIKGQRNGGNPKYYKTSATDYLKYFHIKNTSETYFEHLDIPDDQEEYNYALDLIVEYITLRSEMDDGKPYTSEELKYILAFTLLKKYYNSDFTIIKLSSHLGISVSSINKFLRLAKDDIIIYYNKINKLI